MKLVAVITAFIIMTLSNVVYAADDQGRYTILGNYSCGKVVEEYEKDGWVSAIVASWINGYFTAINRYDFYDIDVSENVDYASRNLWIYNYCKENPLDSLNHAAESLYIELLGRTIDS